jgi:tripartite-type tricarboxylate transporter receptor subunit TctC
MHRRPHPARAVVPAVLFSASVAWLAGSSDAAAQSGNWPQRPIRTIVAYAPGGGTDVVARLLLTFPPSVITPPLSGVVG